MNSVEAIAFVREHGVVLVSAKGPVPRLTESIVNGPIKGSWWAHPDSHRIYATLNDVTGSADILVCRLVDGKVTLVHRRLWPALVRVALRFPAERVAQVQEVHTTAGRHATREVAYPKWVPAEVKVLAARLDEDEALAELGTWVHLPVPSSLGTRRKLHAT